MLEVEFLTILMRDHGFSAEHAEEALGVARRDGIIDKHVGITMHSLGSGYTPKVAVC